MQLREVTDAIGREGGSLTVGEAAAAPASAEVEIDLCLRDAEAERELAEELAELGFEQDPDVLDTWFSSALWPHSTLGWPDPGDAPVDPGQPPLGAAGGEDCLSYYYPGSCLVTGRDIITLWVARMVIAGMYNLGDLPFEHCFVHANILDGKGEMMSKSAGNGIDPVDIIERYGADALRYVMCELQTGSQDIRLPVQAVSPFTGKTIELATAEHGQTIFTYLCPDTGKEFDVLGTMPDLPGATLISDRFDVGRSFCTKLWNAARFAFISLRGYRHRELALGELESEDRWILSRLSRTCAAVQEQLSRYRPSAALAAVREFFWGDLCDWYLELIKPRLSGAADAAGGTLTMRTPRTPMRPARPWRPCWTARCACCTRSCRSSARPCGRACASWRRAAASPAGSRPTRSCWRSRTGRGRTRASRTRRWKPTSTACAASPARSATCAPGTAWRRASRSTP